MQSFCLKLVLARSYKLVDIAGKYWQWVFRKVTTTQEHW